MSKETLIKKTLESLEKLPEQKIKEVADFVDFLIYKIENQLITEGIQKLSESSKSLSFLEEEEELYSRSDLKEDFNK